MLSLRVHCNLKAALDEWLGHRLLPLKSRDQLFTDFTFYANDPMGTHHLLSYFLPHLCTTWFGGP